MIMLVEWTTFHEIFYNQGTIFVKETDEAWEFWTGNQNIFKIKSVVMKKEDQAENMMFIERYLTGKSNVIKVVDIIGYEETNIEEESTPMVSDVSLREEDKELAELPDENYIDNLEPEEENDL